MDDDVVRAAVGEPVADEGAFPSRLPAPGTGGGSELGKPVQLYSGDARPFPTPADVPASPPPVVASGPGDRVGWLLRGRRGKSEDGDAACSADLRGAILLGADLRGAILLGADLRGAILSAAILSDAILGDTILRDAHLRDAHLRDADLRDADLRGARWNSHTSWPDERAAEIREASDEQPDGSFRVGGGANGERSPTYSPVS